MKQRLVLALLLALATSVYATPRVSDIGWLAGDWQGIGDDGTMTGAATSYWTDPAEGVMSWTLRWHQPDEAHIHFAFSVIEESAGNVLLRGIHHGRSFESFEDIHWTMQLDEASGDFARFTCVANCRAASVEFELGQGGSLIESWRTDADGDPVFTITYSRSD